MSVTLLTIKEMQELGLKSCDDSETRGRRKLEHCKECSCMMYPEVVVEDFKSLRARIANIALQYIKFVNDATVKQNVDKQRIAFFAEIASKFVRLLLLEDEEEIMKRLYEIDTKSDGWERWCISDYYNTKGGTE